MLAYKICNFIEAIAQPDTSDVHFLPLKRAKTKSTAVKTLKYPKSGSKLKMSWLLLSCGASYFKLIQRYLSEIYDRCK